MITLTMTKLPPKDSGASVFIFMQDGSHEYADMDWQPEDTLQKAIDSVLNARPECISFEFIIQVVRAIPMVRP